jgi:hypothetical protein
MMIDLNGSEFNRPTVSIFNNGVAGRVNNVTMSVERVHKLDMADKNPDYQVIFTDEIGSINLGIYYPGEESTDSKNKILAQKCTDLVKAVAGDNYIFPSYNSYKEMVDSCMKIISENSKGKLVNVMATYGTVGFPKKFLGIYKNFNFVEAAGSTPTKLKVSKNPNKAEYDDLFERIVEDAPLGSVDISRIVEQTPTKSPWAL